MKPVSRVFLVLLLIVSASLSGCVEAGARPSDAGAIKPTPPLQTTSPAAVSATPSAIEPSPLPMLSPDEFWTSLFCGDPDFTEVPSLGSLIGVSDAVVVVSLERVVPGPTYDAGSNKTEYDAYVMVHVERVLHGSLSQERVPIIVMLSLGDNPSDAALRLVQLQTSMPKEQGILFLWNLVKSDKSLTGLTTSKYDPSVYQVVSAQGVFRNEKGAAKAAKNAPGDWPKKFDGVNFGSVISSIATAKSDK